MRRWELRVAPSAERALSELPHRVAAALVELMVGALLEAPTVVGKPLSRELDGYWSARRGTYRVVYAIDAAARVVTVVRIDHRGRVYRPR